MLGAFDYYGQTDNYYSADNYNQICEQFGVTPAIYNTFYTYNKTEKKLVYGEQNEKMAEHASAGAVCMVHASSTWAEDPINTYVNNTGADKATEKAKFTYNLIDNKTENASDNYDLYHQAYDDYRRQLAEAFNDLAEKGVKTVIFRPFVEMTNSAHWVFYCNDDDAEEYAAFRQAWQELHSYIEDNCKSIDVLWCFAPQFDLNMEKVLNNFYPGDSYVDIIGPTFYSYGADDRSMTLQTRLNNTKYDENIKVLSDRNKPIGFSEIGAGYYSYDFVDISDEDRHGDFEHLINSLKTDKIAGIFSFCSLWIGDKGVFNTEDINPQKYNRNADKFFDKNFFVYLN